MPLEPTAADLLAAVQASPRAVAAHDKTAWVGLFAAHATVNDPVGSAPHLGPTAIGRFYDTFIAPNAITFHVDRDLVAGRTVVRDLSIEITMSTGATVLVPMHLRYDLADTDEGLRITRLAAHWELAPMVLRLLRAGLPGLGAVTVLGPRLVRNQGLSGALGMTRALTGVGRAGKSVVARLLAAAADTDLAGVRELLSNRAEISLPAGHRISVEEFTNRARNIRWDKMLAAGRWVTASIAIGSAHGVAMVEFAPGSLHIVRLEIFLDQ
ncbi:nuclear transport factor 2 family protein [Nocardia higoensis]|uniref:Nuclear transport factor 2 family protein n=1 Tax=Nocardia higoensis TaxID=228599 RepID=A0ABS0D9C8_9NOCA|nr:nuclear transport factor 2 family protein [Nocardia higoensis]MBF6355074.1 nuclear transport factor 2 family protein [Nocardia higoensis]